MGENMRAAIQKAPKIKPDFSFTLTEIYCEKCGRLCETQLRSTGHYDTRTGEMLFCWYKVCHDKRPWNNHTARSSYNILYDMGRVFPLSDVIIPEGMYVEIIR